jgi:WD40 repeat protein
VTGQSDAEWTVEWTSGPATDPRFLRAFTGHGAPVTSVATAVVDGRPVVVAGCKDTAMRIWDLATGELRHELRTGRPDRVSSMTPELLSVATAVVDERAVIVTLHADEDAPVRVWDPQTGRSKGDLHWFVASTTVGGRRVVLTMDHDRTLWMWDPTTAEAVRAVGPVVGLGTPADRLVALTTTEDRSVRVWDLADGSRTGECLDVVNAFLVGDRAFARAGLDGQVPLIWDLGTGHPLSDAETADLESSAARPLNGVSALTRVGNRVVAVTLDHEFEPQLIGSWTAGHHDGDGFVRRQQTAALGAHRVALFAAPDQVLQVWDLTTCPERSDGILHIRTISREEGQWALSSDPAERADLWDLIAGRRGGRISTGNALGVGPRATSRSLLLQGRTVSLAAEKDGTVTVLDSVEGWPSGRSLTGHTDRVCAIDTVPAGEDTLAVTSGLDRTVRMWDLTTRQQRGEPLMGHTGQVWDVATAVVDGRPVAVTAGDDHTVRLWDTTAPGGDRGRTGHTGAVLALATASLDDDPIVVSAGADHTVRLWDPATGRRIAEPLGTEALVMAAATVNGSPVVVTADSDATVHFFDPLTRQDLHPPMPTHHGRVLAMATTSVGGSPVAVTAGSDRAVRVWDLTTGLASGAPLTGHSSRVTALATARLDRGPVAVTGSWDKTVRLWDLTTGRQIGEPLTGHTDWVTSVATLTLDDRTAAITRSRDGALRLWDLTSMTPLSSHALDASGGGSAVTVTTAADGRLMAAIAHDRSVRFLDLTTGGKATTDHRLPLPVHALTAAPQHRLVVAFGTEVAVLRAPTRRQPR